MADEEKLTSLIDLALKYLGYTGPSSVFKMPLETIVVCFQKHSGINEDAMIKDGPDAQFMVEGSKSPVKVKPVSGVYTLILPTNKKGALTIFHTDYVVRHRNKDDLELATDSARAINNWLTMHDVSKRLGQLQRLQILGYYEAPVYANPGASHKREFERASLNFQANTKKLFLDGVIGPKTRNELQSAIGKNADANGYQHVRINLVRFKRYVMGAIADASSNAPHPDDRGGIGAVTGVTKQGKVITSGDKATPEWLIPRVHLVRTRIAVNAPLYIDTDSPDSIQIVEPLETVPLIGNDKELVKFAGIKETTGSLPRVRVRCGSQTGPVIGEMQVIVSKSRIVKCAAYRMTILGAAGPAVAGDTTARSAANIRTFFNQLNAIWRPLGIVFELKSIEDQTINLYHHGWLSNGVPLDASGHDENDQVWIKFHKADRINVFFVPRIRRRTAPPPAETWDDNTRGQGWSRKRARTAGAGFQPGVTVGDVANARTVAHELGHVLELTRHAQSHSDQKNAAKDYLREDSWSRARLMGMYYLYDNKGFQSVEYGWSGGNMERGCLLTIRHYGNHDRTDNELQKSRQVAKNPY